MRFATFCLLALALFLPAHAVFYVKQGNSTANANCSLGDGSIDNPFTSLSQAVGRLGIGKFEIVLIGQGVTIDSVLAIPPLSEYIIRSGLDTCPVTHFPINFEKGAEITVLQSSLTLQDVKIVELDQDRTPGTSPLNVYSGQLNLKGVLVSDILYKENSYTLLSSSRDRSESHVTIADSIFLSLENVRMDFAGTKLSVENSAFLEITVTKGSFMSVEDTCGTMPNTDLSFKKVLFENVTLKYNGEDEPTTFLGFYMASSNLHFEEFVIKNADLDGGTYFIQTINGVEDPEAPTTYNFKKFIIDTVVEKETESTSTGTGILFDLYGASSLVLTDFTVSNVELKYKSMLSYTPNIAEGDLGKLSSSSITTKNIKIEGCKGANLLFNSADQANLDGLELNGNSFELDTNFPLINLMDVRDTHIKNVVATGHSGPIIKSYQGVNQVFENCTFEGHKSSQEYPNSFQYLVAIMKKADNIRDKAVTVFKNFNINGWTDVNGLDITKTSDNCYAFMITSEVGEIIIQDSVWSNLNLGGILGSVKSLKVDGLVVTADSRVPASEIPWHRLFQFVNLGHLDVRNSIFMNHKNINILNLYNIRRGELYDLVDRTIISFDNITVQHSDLVSTKTNELYQSLFTISSPSKPVQFSLTNSHLSNNKIGRGLILVQESSQVDLTISKNLFKDNFAQESGTILTLRDLHEDISTIKISSNTFLNNVCEKVGGVFAFISTRLNVDSRDNQYTKNSAGTSGGVGYVVRSHTIYSEVNGVYSGNQAGSSGGSWHINVGKHRTDSLPFNFIDTVFQDSYSKSKGGAFFSTSGVLNLTNCNFLGNTAGATGGDLHLTSFAELNLKGANISRSCAEIGSVLFADTVPDQNINIDHSKIKDVSAATVLVKANTGSFTMSKTKIRQICGSLFDLDASSASLDNVSIKRVDCTKGKNPFCILQGSVDSLSYLDSKIVDVISSRDLVLLNSPSQDISISNLVVSTVRQGRNDVVGDHQAFVVRAEEAKDLKLKGSSFENLFDFSAVSSARSNVAISKTKFSRTTEFFATCFEHPSQKPVSELVQFVSLDSCTASVQDCSFVTKGSIQNGLNGGAIEIKGTGGNYSILGSTFDGNQAVQGGAISVTGTIDKLSIEGSVFKNNVASGEGGSVYFLPESVVNTATIKGSTFTLNQASQGGAVFAKNNSIALSNNNMKKNSANQDPDVSVTDQAMSKVVDFASSISPGKLIRG